MNTNFFQFKPDHTSEPYVTNVPRKAIQNDNFRTTLWTGKYFQMTLMSIPVCSDIGMEIHEDTDQILKVEQGLAKVKMGHCECKPDLEQELSVGDTVFVPAGTWHNVINTGWGPLKLSVLYAPPHHPAGTVHRTKEDSENNPY